MFPDISAVSCPAYTPEICREALIQVLEPLGGLDWVQIGMRIAVKANLVSAMAPETAATTNPVLLAELVRLLRERGAEVIIGDSPGGLFTQSHLSRVYDVTGLRLCEEAGAVLNMDISQHEAEFPEAVQAKRFLCASYLDSADAVICFCKLKTHGMMAMSGAVKNFFGIIPGTVKPEYHYLYPNVSDFANMLVDLCEYCHPVLSICDAVTAMEGNGPTQGTPRHIGMLAASRSAHSLDLFCSDMIGLQPQQVPTLQAAQKRGLVCGNAADLSVCGNVTDFRIPDFKKMPPRADVSFCQGKGLIVSAAGAFVRKALESVPSVNKSDCAGCGKCARTCPAGAIRMRSGKPSFNRRSCIHCFCCQEFCPEGAIVVRRPRIASLLNPNAR